MVRELFVLNSEMTIILANPLSKFRSDNDSFLNSNRVPIDKIIGYLRHFFCPGKIEDGYSLSIVSGEDGSRLSHR